MFEFTIRRLLLFVSFWDVLVQTAELHLRLRSCAMICPVYDMYGLHSDFIGVIGNRAANLFRLYGVFG